MKKKFKIIILTGAISIFPFNFAASYQMSAYDKLCGINADELDNPTSNYYNKRACCSVLDRKNFEQMKEQLMAQTALTGYSNESGLMEVERMRLRHEDSFKSYIEGYKNKTKKDWIMDSDKCKVDECADINTKPKTFQKEICGYVSAKNHTTKTFEREKEISKIGKNTRNKQLEKLAKEIVSSSFYIEKMLSCYKIKNNAAFDINTCSK